MSYVHFLSLAYIFCRFETKNDDEEMIDIFESGWFKKIKAETTAGENLKIYRELRGMTQKKLGDLLGGTPRRHISNMEKGTRAISLKTAQKLAKIFEISVEKFI